jgi:hypothetical protein
MSSSVPVKPVRPNMSPSCGIDVQRGAHSIGSAPNPTFHKITHAKPTTDLLHIHRSALVGEARIARNHERPMQAREGGGDILDHSIREIVLLRVTAQVLEWQHSD